MKKLDKIRRKVAGFILGDQTALFMSKKNCQLAGEPNFYSTMGDTELAALTRHFKNLVIDTVSKKPRPYTLPDGTPMSEESSFETQNRIYAAMSMVGLAIDTGSTTLRIAVGDTTYLGVDAGNWEIVVNKLSDDATVTNPAGVEIVEDGDKIVEISTSAVLAEPVDEPVKKKKNTKKS